jgi:predicted RNA-binding Zn-ribbon protein involved in translation (DUF1610 family)
MPVNFTCPHCGAQTLVADEFIGRTGACASCGQPITIHGAPSAAPLAAPQKSNALLITLIVGGVILLLCVCTGVPAAFMLPAINAAREAGRKSICQSNLSQIGLALQLYQATHGCFPPAYIPDENGRPMHSWRVLILPFLGEQALYDQYDFNEPWDSAKNQQLALQMPSEYACPTDPDTATGHTSYVAAVGPKRMFPGADARTLAEVTDGPSNTIAVMEYGGSQISWLEPRDGPSPSTPTVNSPPFSNHPVGWYALMGDASVHWVPDSTSAQDVDSLMTVDGGESVLVP